MAKHVANLDVKGDLDLQGHLRVHGRVDGALRVRKEVTAAGFYVPGGELTVPGPTEVSFSDGTHTFVDDTLKFNSQYFYLTPDNSNNPVVNSTRSNVTQITLTDRVHTFQDDTVVFNQSQFYLSRDSFGNPEVNSSVTAQTVVPQIIFTFKDTLHTFQDDTLIFNSQPFYLTKDSSGNPLINAEFKFAFSDGRNFMLSNGLVFSGPDFYLTKNSQGFPEVNVKESLITLLNPVVIASGSASSTITGIPSWAKRVTVIWTGFTINDAGGSNRPEFRLGSAAGGIESSGYVSTYSLNGISPGTSLTSGFSFPFHSNSETHHGKLILDRIGVNTWMADGDEFPTGGNYNNTVGVKTLSGTNLLDRVQVLRAGGTTNTFTGGSWTVNYE